MAQLDATCSGRSCSSHDKNRSRGLALCNGQFVSKGECGYRFRPGGCLKLSSIRQALGDRFRAPGRTDEGPIFAAIIINDVFLLGNDGDLGRLVGDCPTHELPERECGVRAGDLHLLIVAEMQQGIQSDLAS